MKIHLDHPVIDIRTGEPMTVHGTDQVVTVGLALREAVFMRLQEDAEVPGIMYELFKIGRRMVDASEIDLDAEQVALLKRRLERVPAFGPLVIGPVFDALEGRSGASAGPPVLKEVG